MYTRYNNNIVWTCARARTQTFAETLEIVIICIQRKQHVTKPLHRVEKNALECQVEPASRYQVGTYMLLLCIPKPVEDTVGRYVTYDMGGILVDDSR